VVRNIARTTSGQKTVVNMLLFDAHLYTLIMAASIISIVPVVLMYIVAQKSFVEGIATSGLKG
jgi:ABC-type glycerol-3-phosphate transport system permease component